MWPEEVLINAVARALRAEGLSEQSVACAVYDQHHRWYHRGGDSAKLDADNAQDLEDKLLANDTQDVELDLSATVKEVGLKEGHTMAAKYSEPRVDIISTDDIAGCWCCVCAPCM